MAIYSYEIKINKNSNYIKNTKLPVCEEIRFKSKTFTNISLCEKSLKKILTTLASHESLSGTKHKIFTKSNPHLKKDDEDPEEDNLPWDDSIAIFSFVANKQKLDDYEINFNIMGQINIESRI
jgi:hypothetical protein